MSVTLVTAAVLSLPYQPPEAEAHRLPHRAFKIMSNAGKVKYLKRQVHHDRSALRFWRKRRSLSVLQPHAGDAHWHRVSLGIATRNLRRYEPWNLSATARALLGPCGHSLVAREGNFDVDASNPYTGAYGWPQALPGLKMASHGFDWRTNPVTQVRWMISYVNGRYGGMCAADAFQRAHGYY